jgi:hypothetical protein
VWPDARSASVGNNRAAGRIDRIGRCPDNRRTFVTLDAGDYMPTITVHCPQCNAALLADESLVGRRVRCNKCRAAFEVPMPDAPPSEPAAEDPGPGLLPHPSDLPSEWPPAGKASAAPGMGAVPAAGAVMPDLRRHTTQIGLQVAFVGLVMGAAGMLLIWVGVKLMTSGMSGMGRGPGGPVITLMMLAMVGLLGGAVSTVVGMFLCCRAPDESRAGPVMSAGVAAVLLVIVMLLVLVYGVAGGGGPPGQTWGVILRAVLLAGHIAFLSGLRVLGVWLNDARVPSQGLILIVVAAGITVADIVISLSADPAALMRRASKGGFDPMTEFLYFSNVGAVAWTAVLARMTHNLVRLWEGREGIAYQVQPNR